jgi:threonine synthase
MRSYLTHLECTYCGKRYTADEPIRTCLDCGKVLYARYDLEAAGRALSREALQARPANMWRYFEVMPVRDEANVVSLGEGFTPMFKVERLGRRLGSNALFIKDEGMNPTASFKARGLSAAVSRARELGLIRLTVPSAGNAGGALAAYAARAGMEAHVFMPRDAPEANRKEVASCGARLTMVDGLIGDAGRMSRQMAEENKFFDVSTLQEPYRVEGKKSMGYEIAEQMCWKMPDAIICPTGGGTGIVGIWKAIGEMEQLGWLDGKRPKMYCVQAEGCAPMVRAFHLGSEFAEPWENARTVAAGIRVPAAIGDYLILRALRESDGGAITVADQEILEHMKVVASLEGIFVSPEGAATAAALSKLLADGTLAPDETTLLLNTGSGLKYLELV